MYVILFPYECITQSTNERTQPKRGGVRKTDGGGDERQGVPAGHVIVGTGKRKGREGGKGFSLTVQPSSSTAYMYLLFPSAFISVSTELISFKAFLTFPLT